MSFDLLAKAGIQTAKVAHKHTESITTVILTLFVLNQEQTGIQTPPQVIQRQSSLNFIISYISQFKLDSIPKKREIVEIIPSKLDHTLPIIFQL